MPTGARKPYFIFGDAQNSVDLWFFDLARPEPLQFTGKGSAAIAPNDTGDLTGVASYDQGEWSVIFKRPLRAASGAPFAPREFMPVAFSVWDGLTRERGNLRFSLRDFAPAVDPRRVRPRDLSECRPGGLGINFIDDTMDSWRLRPVKHHRGNVLTMRKRLRGAGRNT